MKKVFPSSMGNSHIPLFSKLFSNSIQKPSYPNSQAQDIISPIFASGIKSKKSLNVSQTLIGFWRAAGIEG
ncbi:hypothetical protein [Teichococcus vastitatis]|uniref:Uncharacterized protein n=1 Tax=Teichococcus vastitatis TaxID=2307076 RepID=A0ABS9W657_9PROT|nr:hypothetical protein [Pseudoroseomonas vastitatis]MCI0754776.1 hypothetical protein [Pseudoroseomonas vastitatis]